MFRVVAVMLMLGALPGVAQKKMNVPQPVIIDADVGDDIDDAFAVALALKTPQFQIVGISTAFGDTELRAHLFLRMLEEAGIRNVPLAVGIHTEAHNRFSQAEYAKGDTHALPKLKSVDFLLEQARKRPGKITLIALGPLMNIGAAIDRDPEGFRKFKRVVMMGGSIHLGYTKGDSTKHPAAAPEWNIKCDPESARKLLASGVPVFMMPLDSTQVLLPEPLKQKIAAQEDGLSKALTELYREYGKPAVLYDAVTVAYASDASFCPVTPMHVEVTDKGMTVQSEGKPNANVCLKADEAAFLRMFGGALVR